MQRQVNRQFLLRGIDVEAFSALGVTDYLNTSPVLGRGSEIWNRRWASDG
jgi:hypothetical protein